MDNQKEAAEQLNGHAYQQPIEQYEHEVKEAVEQDLQIANGSEVIEEQASLQDEIASVGIMGEMGEEDIHYKIRRLNQKTEELHADEQFLKEELKVRQQQTLYTFQTLVEKKRQLLKLVNQNYNKTSALVDIALTEELDELKRIIQGQQATIQQLRIQVSRQGLAGVLNDESFIKIKNKAEQIEKQIKVGRKFSSTQYVRDYLERPQAYKVNYEQAKYEYELRIRIKQCLEEEKKLYERKKEQINLAKKRMRQLEQELHKQKDLLSK